MCPLEEVEQETVESKEVSGLIIECVSHRLRAWRLCQQALRQVSWQLEHVILKSSTVHINSSSGDKTGAPAVNARSESPPATVDKSLLHHKLSIPLQSKLPKIELPKFAHDVTKFRSFWESFTNSVDLSPNLSITDKFNYLKALLEGSAARSIQGLALTKNKYAVAIDILQKRFSKTQKIICGPLEDTPML